MSRGLKSKQTTEEWRIKKGDAPQSRIECDYVNDILIDNHATKVLVITEAVVWY